MSAWARRIQAVGGTRIAQAVLFAVAASILVLGSWAVAPGILTSLDWWLYDASRGFMVPGPTDRLVLLTRDQAGDARFGEGPWDRAVVARLVKALDQAGAVVVALDIHAGEPSPPERGGATSDALLFGAMRDTGKVVYPLSLRLERGPNGADGVPSVTATRESLRAPMRHARGVGHDLVSTDADGVVRRVPHTVRFEGQRIQALGLAVAQAFLGEDVLARQNAVSPVLVPMPSRPFARAEASVPLLTVYEAIEQGEGQRLREWVEGRVVMVLVRPSQPDRDTPMSQRAAAEIHASLAQALLTNTSFREVPQSAVAILAFAMAGLGVWILMSRPGWVGLLGVVAIAIGYAALVLLGLFVFDVVLPSVTPLLALLLSTGGAALWMSLAAGGRIGALEREMRRTEEELASAREHLALQESAVEVLEEDLEAARAEACRSVTKEADLAQALEDLESRCVEAREQEGSVRARMQELEREVHGLRAVSVRGKRLYDSEDERLRLESERTGILTRDAKVLALFRDLKKVAQASLPVLLLGEPGTGKEVFARALHGLSPRAQGPFVPVNMAAISPELFESEVFGHVKGSFSGAIADRKGYFELADRGTLFLDEIGDLPYEHQGKLLRALQDRTFYKVGAIQPTRVDVRVVAATNKDLAREVFQGGFREDLYFRLKGLVLRLPPLRERRLDLPLLAQHFLQDAAARSGRQSLGLSREALSLLEGYPWRGNIRELQQCIEQAVALAEGKVVTREDLRLGECPSEDYPKPRAPATPAVDPANDQAVLACLRLNDFDVQATARAMDCDRGTITQRLKGLGFRALVDSRGDQMKAALTVAGDPALARRVSVKLEEYYRHLLNTIQPFDSALSAIEACRKRFKNLPTRHFRSLEILVHQHFERTARYHQLGTE